MTRTISLQLCWLGIFQSKKFSPQTKIQGSSPSVEEGIEKPLGKITMEYHFQSNLSQNLNWWNILFVISRYSKFKESRFEERPESLKLYDFKIIFKVSFILEIYLWIFI